MEKENNNEVKILSNEDNIYVTFEQAEMLAHMFNYTEETKCAYDAKTKELIEFPICFNHNRNKMWAGIYGWHYSRYAAPKKDEVILWLMDKLDFVIHNKN